MKAKHAVTVPPLTSTKLDGTPYVRHADITTAIGRALSLPKDQWEEWAARSDNTRLPSEALVFLIKSTASVDRNLFGRLVWQLNMRIEAIAKRWSRGFDPHTTEEIIESVAQRIIEVALLTSPTRQSDFLEVAFSKAVKRYTLNAVEKRRNAPMSLTVATTCHSWWRRGRSQIAAKLREWSMRDRRQPNSPPHIAPAK